jgi:hypothetical protein
MALPRSDAQRKAKYDAKSAATTVGLKIAARLDGMYSSFEAFINDFVPIQEAVRAELATDATVFPIWYGGYYAYAAELWKLQKTTTGPQVDASAQIVKTKWTTRGLTGTMLISIAANVFGITVT